MTTRIEKLKQKYYIKPDCLYDRSIEDLLTRHTKTEVAKMIVDFFEDGGVELGQEIHKTAMIILGLDNAKQEEDKTGNEDYPQT